MNISIPNIKVLAVDDNALMLNLLEIALQNLGISHFLRARTAEECIEISRNETPDIYFIDIVLSPGKKDGGDLGILLREENPNVPIIFLTSYYQQEYYDYVKSVRPTGFMNKELSQLKLLQIVELAINQINDYHNLGNSAKKKVRRKAPSTKSDNILKAKPEHLFFKVGDIYKPISIDDINMFFADNKLTYARVKNRNYPTVAKLKELTNQLDPIFLRCHNKYLVNASKITAVNTKESTVDISGETLPIGYAFRKDFLKGLNLLK